MYVTDMTLVLRDASASVGFYSYVGDCDSTDNYEVRLSSARGGETSHGNSVRGWRIMVAVPKYYQAFFITGTV